MTGCAGSAPEATEQGMGHHAANVRIRHLRSCDTGPSAPFWNETGQCPDLFGPKMTPLPNLGPHIHDAFKEGRRRRREQNPRPAEAMCGPNLEPLRRAPRQTFVRPSWAKPDLNGAPHLIAIGETVVTNVRAALSRNEVTDGAVSKLFDMARQPLSLRRYAMTREFVQRLGVPGPRRSAVKRRHSGGPPTQRRRPDGPLSDEA